MLSRRPVWLNPDHTLGPDEGLDFDDGNDFAMRVIGSKPNLHGNNPLLKELESVGSKNSEYHNILYAIRTGSSSKSLPAESEARKMGEEWDMMGVIEETEVVYIGGVDGIDRIYLPKPYMHH